MTTSPTSTTDKRSSRKTVRYLAGAAMVSSGLVVGALFSPIGIASAQNDVDDATTESVEAPKADATPGEQGQRGGPGHGRGPGHGPQGQRGEKLAEITGLTTEQLSEGRTAGQTLAETAEANGIAVDDLTATLSNAANERLQDAVTDGHLTQDQADEKAADLDTRIEEMINRTPSERGERGGPAHGRGPQGQRGEKLAEITGLTTEQLSEGRTAGQTLAETAEANGIAVDDLTATLSNAANERLQDAVTDGHLTQDQADEKAADLDTRIEEMINRTPSERGERGGPAHGRGHGTGHGPGDQGPADDEGETVESSLTT